MKFTLEKKGRIKRTTRTRLVWPSTWQATMFEGIRIAGSKKKSEYAALRKFDDLSRGLSSDEYDAVNLAVYQWLMCRPLGAEKLKPSQQRTLEIIASSGHAPLTTEEVERLR